MVLSVLVALVFTPALTATILSPDPRIRAETRGFCRQDQSRDNRDISPR